MSASPGVITDVIGGHLATSSTTTAILDTSSNYEAAISSLRQQGHIIQQISTATKMDPERRKQAIKRRTVAKASLTRLQTVIDSGDFKGS